MHSNSSWYTPEVDMMAPFSLYTQSFYFMVTTMTTVGYGDMTVGTDNERTFCAFIMVVGVVIFGYVSGSIASALTILGTSN